MLLRTIPANRVALKLMLTLHMNSGTVSYYVEWLMSISVVAVLTFMTLSITF